MKSARDGSFIYLKDVARVELGAENYQSYSTTNGYPSAGLGISLASGANAIATSSLIKAEIERLSQQLPEGYKIAYPRDNTRLSKNRLKKSLKLYSRRSFWSSS